MDIKDVLDRIAKESRSNKDGFYKTDRLDAIDELLTEVESPFHIVQKTPHVWIYGQKEPQLGEQIVLVSTHTDIVKSIKNPFSNLNEETKYFKGTYDNLGTNGVCTSLMANEELPDNVYFAFTDEEETGRCLGAKDALHYLLKNTQTEPIVLALDVTDEGYKNDRLFTIEGLHGVNEYSRKKMLEIFMGTEGEKQSFEVVKLKKKDDNSFLPKSYQNETLTIFDESVFYAENNCNSCSLCLPGDGSMHSDDGFYVKEGVMRGYEKSLLLNIYVFTRTYPEKYEELKAEKDQYIQQAKDTSFFKKYASSYSSAIQSTGFSQGSSYKSSASPEEMFSYRDYLMDSYNDYMSYNDSYGMEEEDDFSYEEFLFMQATDDAYEMAEGYAEDEFEIFFQDIVAMYGIEDNEYTREVFEEIFVSVKEEEQDYEENDLENFYDVDME